MWPRERKQRNQQQRWDIPRLQPTSNKSRTLESAWITDVWRADMGELAHTRYQAKLHSTVQSHGCVYVVWSNGTPIAWHHPSGYRQRVGIQDPHDGGWILVDRKIPGSAEHQKLVSESVTDYLAKYELTGKIESV